MRVIKKKYRVLTACVLAGLLMAAAPGIGRSIRAGESVDMTKTGTLKLSLGTEDSLEMALDMAQMREPLQVRLWKLADMTETGNYEFQGAFQGLTVGKTVANERLCVIIKAGKIHHSVFHLNDIHIVKQKHPILRISFYSQSQGLTGPVEIDNLRPKYLFQPAP